MKTGIGDYYLRRYGIEDGARLMAEDGYDAIDLNFANTETEFYSAKESDFFILAGKYKSALKKNNITVEQIHGPWRFPAQDATEDDRAERFGKMTKSLALAKFFDARYVAIHPLMPFGAESAENPEKVYEINKKFYTALASVAEKLGVTVCLENMPFREFPLSSTESIISLIKDINSPALKFCFDTGHALYYGESVAEAVKTAGSEYLRILHVHDNCGDEDYHLPPYEGIINWADFIEALYDIGFDGVMNLETTPAKYDGFKSMSEDEKHACELKLAKIAKLLAGK